jgi:ABC-type multidrug transport system fused ATPase/permease subunit
MDELLARFQARLNHLINSILVYFQNISLSQLGQKVVLQIRKNLFTQMITLPQSFFEKAQTGDLTSRISKDTADTQDILESFITIFVRSVPTVIGILIVSFTIDWMCHDLCTGNPCGLSGYFNSHSPHQRGDAPAKAH